MSRLPARAGYALWAPSYDTENAVSFLENQLADRLAPAHPGARLLDAACGTGRRLAEVAAQATGIDVSLPMLEAGSERGRVAAADLRVLPFRARTFDLVWCRLAIGHLPDLDAAYAELARVCDVGGSVFISDFHPAAATRGHRRTFRDGEGTCHELEHFVHPVDSHVALAARHRLLLEHREEGVIGPLVQHFFDARDMAAQYSEQLGLPIVLALRFRRVAA